MNLVDIIRKANLDWSKLIFEIGSNTTLFYDYQLSPNDFLTFAKADLYKADVRGLVNALSNAKRAIDCQTDVFISALGFSPNDIAKQLGKNRVQTIAKASNNPKQPLTFKVLESFGVITPSILGRMRSLRHLLEHHYKKPTKQAASDAIDIASLYLRACEGMMKDFINGFGIGIGRIKVHKHFYDCKRELYFHFENEKQKHIYVLFWDRTSDAKIKQSRVKIYADQQEYYLLLKLFFAIHNEEALEPLIIDLLSALNIPVAKKMVQIVEGL